VHGKVADTSPRLPRSLFAAEPHIPGGDFATKSGLRKITRELPWTSQPSDAPGTLAYK